MERLDLVRSFFLFSFGIVHRDGLTPEIKRRYLAPNHVGIAWGMKDAAFTHTVLDELWLGTFPNAVVTRRANLAGAQSQPANQRGRTGYRVGFRVPRAETSTDDPRATDVRELVESHLACPAV